MSILKVKASKYNCKTWFAIIHAKAIDILSWVGFFNASKTIYAKQQKSRIWNRTKDIS